MQSMDVSKFWDLMINALKAANEVSPLNKKWYGQYWGGTKQMRSIACWHSMRALGVMWSACMVLQLECCYYVVCCYNGSDTACLYDAARTARRDSLRPHWLRTSREQAYAACQRCHPGIFLTHWAHGQSSVKAMQIWIAVAAAGQPLISRTLAQACARALARCISCWQPEMQVLSITSTSITCIDMNV